MPFAGNTFDLGNGCVFVDFSAGPCYDDNIVAKSSKAFRLAALRRGKTAELFCHIRIAMSIGRMIQRERKEHYALLQQLRYFSA